MYQIVVHKRAAKKLNTVQKSYLRNFSSLLETLKTNPLPWRDFDLKKIEGIENTYRLESETTELSILSKERKIQYIY